MRTVTSPTQIKMDTALGTEPQLICQINWSSGTEYYGYKTFTLDTWSVKGAIIDVSTIISQLKQEVTGEISSVSMELDDSDGGLKSKVNTEVIEGTLVTLYHHYEGLSQSDLVVILKGRIAGDVIWNEGKRTLSFDIESYVSDDIVGYAPKAGDITNLWSEAEEVPWPLAFGTVLKSPAVRIRNRQLGTLVYGINANFTSFEVEKGDTFIQNTAIQIQIGAIRFNGSFNDRVFTVTEANVPYYTNLTIANRPMNDRHYNDASVLWLPSDTTVKLNGLYCIVNHPTYGWMVNKCLKQEGSKVYFVKPWRPATTTLEVKLNNSHTISEVAPAVRSSWAVPYAVEHIARWDNSTVFGINHEEVVGMSYVLQGSWSLGAGSEVKYMADFNNLYIANLIPSTEILEVYGHRNLNGQTLFVPIPSSYYTIKLSDSLAGYNPTTIEFPIALEDYPGEEWEGDVYVSLRSSVGPNVGNIISYLITNWSTLGVDTTSFADVISKIDRYPAGFTLFDLREVLELIEDIAWQARCALYIKNNNVYIKYLSEVPTAIATIEEADILLKSMVLSFTSTEDLYTRLNAKWRSDYVSEERIWTYSNNISNYGLYETDRDFYIYNIESLVILSAAFWGYRYSNSWRNIEFSTFLSGLDLEAFDPIALNAFTFSANTIRAVIDLVNHNAIDNEIVIKAQIASRAGDASSGEPTENLNYFIGDPNHTINGNPMPGDVGAGRSQVDYIVPTQGQTTSDPDSDPATGSGGTGTGDPDVYSLEITSEPTEVQRGVAFTLAVRIKDSLGNTVYEDTTATIGLISTDGSDTLNTTNINIVNGTWSSSSMQITGGSGDDTGTLTVAAGGYEGDETASFPIIAARVDTLSWSGIPSSVTREAVIPSYTLSGGANGEIIDIVLASSDGDDYLYDSSNNIITQITLGAGGSYTFTGTYIKGGQGSDIGTITAVDQTQNKYVTKQSSQFDISGLSAANVVTNIAFSQSVESNKDYLSITPPSNIIEGEGFDLTVEILNPDDTRDTSYNETIRLEAFNNDTGDRLQWTVVGPNASNYGGFIYANLANGIWEYDSCEIDINGADTVRIEAEILYKETEFNDSVLIAIETPFFNIDSPSNIVRGIAFNISLQAMNGDGTINTSYIPSGNVTFTLSGTGLNGEIITPNYTDNTGWSNGAKSVTVTITGGTGNKAIKLEVDD